VSPFRRKWTISGRFLLVKRISFSSAREPVLEPGDPLGVKERGFLRVIYRRRLSVRGGGYELINESLVTCLGQLKRIRESFRGYALERRNHRGRFTPSPQTSFSFWLQCMWRSIWTGCSRPDRSFSADSWGAGDEVETCAFAVRPSLPCCGCIYRTD
jgi:hypothetical protein